MITECQCDMPIFAYCDWLRDQGWEVDEAEFTYVVTYQWYGSGVYKHFGCSVEAYVVNICNNGWEAAHQEIDMYVEDEIFKRFEMLDSGYMELYNEN